MSKEFQKKARMDWNEEFIEEIEKKSPKKSKLYEMEFWDEFFNKFLKKNALSNRLFVRKCKICKEKLLCMKDKDGKYICKACIIRKEKNKNKNFWSNLGKNDENE